MPDPRFHSCGGPFHLSYLAALVGASFAGDNDVLIDDVAELGEASASSICLFMDDHFLAALSQTKAAAVVTTLERAIVVPRALQKLLVPVPRVAFALLQQAFYPTSETIGWIAPQAVIHPSAIIGDGCRIEPGAVIEAGVLLGAKCSVGADSVIGAGVVLGEGCRIDANVSISHALIGDRVQIFASSVIGRPGFGFVAGPTGPVRMPQLGRVVIGDDVEIGAGCTLDRGALGDTRIGAGCKIDNGVQIAHNVVLGRACILAGHVGIAGSTTLGDFVVVGGGVVISDHVSIGAGAQIAIGSCVIRDVPAKAVVGGYPAVAVRTWHRQTVATRRLAER